MFQIKSSFHHFSHLLISDMYVFQGALMLPKTFVSDFGASLYDYASCCGSLMSAVQLMEFSL